MTFRPIEETLRTLTRRIERGEIETAPEPEVLPAVSQEEFEESKAFYILPRPLQRCSKATWRGDWHPWPVACEEWTGEPWSVLILGKPGRGKSHLAAAIVRVWIARGLEAQWVDLPLAIEDFKGAMRWKDDEGYERLLDRMRCKHLTVYDDLGAEASEWGKDQIPLWLRYRYHHQLPTVVTCNAQSLREVGAEVDARIASRLAEGLCITLGGKDRRPDLRVAPPV